MAWYSKYAQQRISQIAAMRQHAIQTMAVFVKPTNKKRSWLVGSSLLLLLAPVSVYAMHAQSQQANNVEDVLTSADEATKQAVDLSVESSLGSFGQNADTAGQDIQSHNNASGSGDISLQANITGQDASVTLNGQTTELNPEHDTFHQKVESKNGKTNIDISIKNGGVQASGGGITVQSSSSVEINTESHSSSSDDSEPHDSDYYRHERNR